MIGHFYTTKQVAGGDSSSIISGESVEQGVCYYHSGFYRLRRQLPLDIRYETATCSYAPIHQLTLLDL